MQFLPLPHPARCALAQMPLLHARTHARTYARTVGCWWRLQVCFQPRVHRPACPAEEGRQGSSPTYLEDKLRLSPISYRRGHHLAPRPAPPAPEKRDAGPRAHPRRRPRRGAQGRARRRARRAARAAEERACVQACAPPGEGGGRPRAHARRDARAARIASRRAIQRRAGRVGARRTPGFRAGRACRGGRPGAVAMIRGVIFAVALRGVGAAARRAARLEGRGEGGGLRDRLARRGAATRAALRRVAFVCRADERGVWVRGSVGGSVFG